MNKRGQAAIFIIVAIVIVGLIAALYLFPTTRNFISGSGEVDPNAYLSKCLADDVKETISKVSMQGGSYEPDNFLLYEGEKVQYLCYTTENYKPCVVQQPLLLGHVEKEVKTILEPKARECFSGLRQEYESRGYSVSGGEPSMNVTIIPKQIRVNFGTPFTVTKQDTQTFRQFSVSMPSEMYDLLLTSVSIVQFESALGDSETTLYMQYYPDLKIEKFKRDADKIYTVSNVVTKESFRFASRSLVWPQGYGLEGQQ